MLFIFIKMLLTEKDTKAVIHCSAGIGRTGTTIALAHLIINLCAQKNAKVQTPVVSVFSTVRRLREQRWGLVQVPEQYIFIYLFLIGWAQANGF